MTSPADKRLVPQKKRIAQGGAGSPQERSPRRDDDHKRHCRSIAKTSQTVVAASRSKTVRLAASTRRALNVARSFQAVTKIRGQAEGIRAYAKALNDWTLETEAVEIRVRATRRLGQMIAEQKKAGGLSKGNAGLGRPRKGAVRKTAPIPSLRSQGINDHLRKQAGMLAQPSENLFEEVMSQWRRQAEARSEPMMRDLMSSLRKAAKGEQLDWVGHSQLDLSKSWEEINRIRQKNALAPDSLKLDQIVTSIIDVFADAIGKLKKLVARLDQPREARRFQEVFHRMAEHVTERVDSYRTLVKNLEDMDRAQERRATWRHPDIQPDPPRDEPPEPPEEDGPLATRDGDQPDIPF